jgi:hypothetical protein
VLKLWKKFLAILAACTPRSTAGQASAVTFACLLLMWILVWTLRLYGPFQIPNREVISWVHWTLELLLLIAIPTLLYFGLKIWSRKLDGQFPDIDRAWIAGINALKDLGETLTDKPIFFIIGSPDVAMGRNLMNATQATLLVQGIPNTYGVQAPLQWYVSENAIYLFCNGASSLSVLQKRMGLFSKTTLDSPIALNNLTPPTDIPSPKTTQPSSPPPPARPPLSTQVEQIPSKEPNNATSTPEKTPESKSQVSSGQPSSGPIGTISADMLRRRSIESQVQSTKPLLVPNALPPSLDTPKQMIENQLKNIPIANQPIPTVSSSNLATIFATEKIQSKPRERTESPTIVATPEPSAAPATSPLNNLDRPRKPRKSAFPEHLDASENCLRLAYLCRILRKSRKGHCGINGVLALLPFQLTHLISSEIDAISKAARDDLHTIQETLRLKFPVSALLLGLEREKGFKELVRRLPQDLLARRLGGKFDIRTLPTSEQLNHYSDELCYIFEDWVQNLFRQEDALPQQRGNRRLYELVCKVRNQLKPRLRLVLGDSFGYADAEDPPMPLEKAPFFSGCYFAACGEKNEQNAFVRGVLVDKLIAEQSSVEWTNAALVENRINRSIAAAGWFFALGFLLIGLFLLLF